MGSVDAHQNIIDRMMNFGKPTKDKPTDVKPDPALIKRQNDLIRKEREDLDKRRIGSGTDTSNGSGTLG